MRFIKLTSVLGCYQRSHTTIDTKSLNDLGKFDKAKCPKTCKTQISCHRIVIDLQRSLLSKDWTEASDDDENDQCSAFWNNSACFERSLHPHQICASRIQRQINNDPENILAQSSSTVAIGTVSSAALILNGCTDQSAERNRRFNSQLERTKDTAF